LHAPSLIYPLQMSSEEEARASLDFAESSILEAIAPAASNVDIEEAFSSWDGTVGDEGASILPFVKQRHVLLFGMCDRHFPLGRRLTHAQAR
jgi:hypothetical protein